MHRPLYHLLTFIAMMVGLTVAQAQVFTPRDDDNTPSNDTVGTLLDGHAEHAFRHFISDTLVPIVELQSRTTAIPIAEAELQHSPRKALLLSIIPGAGQIYNGQAWKVPVIYGAFAVTGYFMVFNNHEMRKFRDEYLHRINGGTPQLDGYTNYPDNSIYNYYQSYNQNFQLTIILSAIFYTLNLVDAYIYGHLYDFQINDDISMRLQPTLQSSPTDLFRSPIPLLSCSFHF